MPLRFELSSTAKKPQDRSHIRISDAEIVELSSAYRLYGCWRWEIDTGHFFASEDVYEIFGMTFSKGPMNLVEVMSRIHEDDKSIMAETYEQASLHKLGFHFIYRVGTADEGFRYVRSVGKFRNDDNSGGEIIGITYELLERMRTVGFGEEA
ncbi:PAS domain-containing protein [Rhizobium sp. BK251]|uniref:PAS domain-containing protein n=1 Tax=Rhizobium sp. BK251 TaxID=2512125 RepID=UPI0010530C25|nr:PAS domain-containing protein [Rhizobium sp. BK251]TCL74704.1 PAS domain-containing protein [Rhizobium sp. BK251]